MRRRSVIVAALGLLIGLVGAACGRWRFGEGTPPAHELVWFDTSGRRLGTVPVPRASYERLWLARDERTAVAAFSRPAGSGPDPIRLWKIDLHSGETEPFAVSVAGTATRERRLTHWSERHLLFDVATPGGGRDIWSAAIAGDEMPYLTTPWIERDAQLAAEGRWLAYVSEETGTPEVYVQTFPDPSLGRWLVSAPPGGERPVWRDDSRVIYYTAPGGRIMAVPLTKGRALIQPGHAALFFTAPTPLLLPYAVTGDGHRILMAVPARTVTG